MRLLPLVSLLVYTFGAIAFAELSLFWTRSHRKSAVDATGAATGILIVVSASWFILNLSSVLADLAHGGPYFLLYTLLLFLSTLFAPLLMQIGYFKHRDRLAHRVGWKATLAVVWTAAFASMSSLVAVNFKPTNTLVTVLFINLCALFLIAGAFNVLLVAGSRRATIDANARRHHFADIVLWTFAALLIAFGLFGGPDTWMPGASALFQLALRSTPLYFLFVGTYYDRRIAFYDIFVKRGALVLAALTLLMLYFAVIAPLVERVPLGPAIVWLHALALFPLVVITPWINRAIGAWIDRHWLGRRFSAAEATSHLFDGLQNAVTEDELIQHAETRLSEIFQAVITVTSDNRRRADRRDAIVVREVPIEFQGETIGAIHLGKRRADAPYLSQDLSLIGSLGGVIGSMLENVRLQSRRREQLAVEQELRLHASRSELKALRAQINPHFLFNALNAIVALIPTKPERAEETLEQLAEVFRYTLTRSDKEWTRLADEVDFVRAYLDVEKARFGDRLQATIDVDPKVQDMTVPSMMLQTLVENAVKHGLSSVRGVGVLSIEAKADDERVRIVVRDNGADAESNGRKREAPIGEGYGLRNIRERLGGHFGDRASFSLTRDRATSTTVAAIELPLKP